MNFIATYKQCVQIGPDDFKMQSTSKKFTYDNTFSDVILWLQSIGVKKPVITMVEFSDLCD